MAHNYPGNVRELENIIEYAFVLCPDTTIEPKHLPAELVARGPGVPVGADLDSAVEATEARTIQDALRGAKGNRLEAAKALGMHKSTLFRKMKALHIRAEGRLKEMKR